MVFDRFCVNDGISWNSCRAAQRTSYMEADGTLKTDRLPQRWLGKQTLLAGKETSWCFVFNSEFTIRQQWFRICFSRFTKFVSFLSCINSYNHAICVFLLLLLVQWLVETYGVLFLCHHQTRYLHELVWNQRAFNPLWLLLKLFHVVLGRRQFSRWSSDVAQDTSPQHC